MKAIAGKLPKLSKKKNDNVIIIKNICKAIYMAVFHMILKNVSNTDIFQGIVSK